MKVLVATHETQGQRKNDFCHASEGELVRFNLECDGEKVDGHCGCRRSMSGVESLKSTTTMKVVESLTVSSVEDLAERVKLANIKGGWADLYSSSKELEEDCLAEAHELTGLAEFFPTGTIVEKRGRDFKAREVK